MWVRTSRIQILPAMRSGLWGKPLSSHTGWVYKEKTMRQAEILNGLEAITELLYEVDAYDKEYSSQVIANAMEIIMEVDL